MTKFAAPRDSTTADPIDAEPELIDEAVVIASVDLNPGDVLLTRVVGELDAIVDEGCLKGGVGREGNCDLGDTLTAE